MLIVKFTTDSGTHVESGALIAYIGIGGQLEIARRNGSAARRTGAERETIVRLRSPTS